MYLLLLLCSAIAPIDVPQIALDEIARRGNYVERIGDVLADDQISDVMRPPADDSHKWFVSLITRPSCPACERLKKDFAESQELRAFANPGDHRSSWAHYNVFSADDATQRWRFAKVSVDVVPVVLVQPPRNGDYGDPHTVVFQASGYDGNAAKLAAAMRDAMVRYAKTRLPAAVGADEVGVDPPFQVPPRPVPVVPGVPFSPPAVPQVPPMPLNLTFGSLLMLLLGSLLPSGVSVTNVLLIVILAMSAIRTFRKATGQKLLLDEETFQKIVDVLRSGGGLPRSKE